MDLATNARWRLRLPANRSEGAIDEAVDLIEERLEALDERIADVMHELADALDDAGLGPARLTKDSL